MSVAGTFESSLRLDSLQTSRLTRAFAISVLVHLLCFGGYQLNTRFHLLERVHLPAWLVPPKPASPPLALGTKPSDTTPQRELQLVFVDVNPAQASAEPPKDAKYYSDKSSVAANPKPDVQSSVPKIEGNQTRIVKAEDVPRSVPQPLQPAVASPPPEPVAQPVPEPVEPAKPKPSIAPGELAMVRPGEVTQKEEGQETHVKPRRLEDLKPEVRAKAQELKYAGLAGEKMKQDGGVARRGNVSLDVRGTLFGAYDAAFVARVQNRWDILLDSGNFARDGTGKVVVEFKLNNDGRITDLKTIESTVSTLLEILCRNAITDPAPYDRWPNDMRRLIGASFRDVTFTFYYN